MPITKDQVHFSTDDFRVYVNVYSIVPGAIGSLIVTPDKIDMCHGPQSSTIIIGIDKDNKHYDNILENMRSADRKLVLCTGMRLYKGTTNRYYKFHVTNIQEYPVAGYIEIHGSIRNDGGEDALWRNDTKNRIECSVFLPKITRVAYNFPATIVWWSDGTKTVVKMTKNDDWFDKEVGLAMAISRKYLELSGYSNVRSAFKRFIDEADVYGALGGWDAFLD